MENYQAAKQSNKGLGPMRARFLANQLQARRIARESQSFKCEEKLDKWLDLQKPLWLQQRLSGSLDFTAMDRTIFLQHYSEETLNHIQAHGISPQEIKDAVLSPRIVAVLVDRALTPNVVRSCHLNQQALRRVLAMAKSASTQSLQLQLEHLASSVGSGILDHCVKGIDDLVTRAKDWPPILYQCYLMMEDAMFLLQQYKRFHEYIPIKQPEKRAHYRFRVTKPTRSNIFYFLLPAWDAEVRLTAQLSLMRYHNVWYLITEELLLELVDKLSELFCAGLHCHMISGVSQPGDFFESSIAFWRILASHMVRSPLRNINGQGAEPENVPFGLLKSVEGLGVAQIILKEDSKLGWNNTDLLKTMWAELYNGGTVREAIYENHPLGQLFMTLDAPVISELLGTVKLFGHPCIELDVGTQQLYDRTHADLMIDNTAVKAGIGVMIRELTKQFFLRHGRYPNIENISGLTGAVRELFETKLSLLTPRGSQLWARVTTQDWATVTFGHNEEFDPVDNQLPLIKDKALGITRSQIYLSLIQEKPQDYDGKHDVRTLASVIESDRKHQQEITQLSARVASLNAQIRHIREGPRRIDLETKAKNRPLLRKLTSDHQTASADLRALREKLRIKTTASRSRAEKRALLIFLLEDSFSDKVRDYLNKFIEEDPWSDAVRDYLVIKLTAKELELKTVGRFFGASPIYERNRRVIADTNVMRLLDNYFPDQLMTPDDLGIMRKLVSFRYFGSLYPNHVLFQISFDFKKWNNNFREESIDFPAHAVLDQWFGIPGALYGKTMRAFKNTLVYLSEMTQLSYWAGQDGGIEGLAQPTWSLVFLCGLKNALEQAGYMYQLSVKGDDVRCVIAVPGHQVTGEQSCIEVRDGILRRIKELCQQWGWDLNPHESFISLTVIATSKQYQVRDTWLPASTKKAMKMLSLSNLLFPTLEDLISSIFSSAHSSCAQGTATICTYYSASFLAANELQRNYKPNQLTADSLTALLLWPQILGGPGSLPLQTFIVRGENDMLTASLSLLRSVGLYGPGSMRPLIRNILRLKMSKHPSPSLLLSDPYALPLEIPKRPASILQDLIKGKLKDWVKNRDIKYLLTDAGQVEHQDFCNALQSMRPYHAKVATTMYECSPFYLIREVLSKFMESPTVIALFMTTKDYKDSGDRFLRTVLAQVLKAAAQRESYWLDQLSLPTFLFVPEYLGVPEEIFWQPFNCATKLAHMIRESSWGFPIHDITYPSLVDQVFMDTKPRIVEAYPRADVYRSMYTITLHPQALTQQTDSLSHHYAALPNHHPWVGSHTAAKVHFPTLTTNIKSPSLSKVIRLITLGRTIANMGDQIQECVGKLISALTSVPLADLLLISPEGDVGHITHRLPINAFSMTTMPNYRSNILQLSIIDTESLYILKADNRDRTINFAALHYYMAFMVTLPLQFSERFSDGYPQILGAVFQPHNHEGAKMELCPYCEEVVVDDHQVEMAIPIRDDITRFNSIPLIGCSPYDNNTLQTQIAEFLYRRTGHALVRPGLPADDPVLVEVSARCVLHNLIRSSISGQVRGTFESFIKVPHGQLRDMYSASLGHSDVSKVSIAVIRYISPTILYDQTLAAVYLHMLSLSETEDFSVPVRRFLTLPESQNSLGEYFEVLTRAGVLDRLVIGCHQAHRGTVDLNWTAGDFKSGSRAASSFVRCHYTKLLNILTGKESIRVVRQFMSMDNYDTLITNLYEAYRSRLRWAHMFVLRRFGGYHYLQSLFNQGLTHLASLGISYEDTDPTSLHIMFEDLGPRMQRWIQGLDLDSDSMDRYHDFKTLASLCVTTLLPYRVKSQIEDVLDPDTLRELVEVDLFVINEEVFNLNFDVLTEERLEELLPGLCKAFPVNFLLRCLNSIGELTQDVGQLSSTICDHMVDQLSFIDRHMAAFQRVSLNNMTLEEAVRITRKHPAVILDIAHDREEILNALYQNLTDHPLVFDQHDNNVPECPDCDEASLRIRSNLILPVLEQHANQELMVQSCFPGVPTASEFLEMHGYSVDQAERARCVGRHNTSICKYIEVLQRYGPSMEFVSDQENSCMILCMADGLGGCTAFFANHFINSRMLYNSLTRHMRTTTTPADCNPGGPPVEALDPYYDKLMRYRIIYEGFDPGDLTARSIQDMIRSALSVQPIPLALVTMDADRDWNAPDSEYEGLLFGALRSACVSININTICIFKSFIVAEHSLAHFLHFLYMEFEHVHLYRPRSTRMHSHEVLIIFTKCRDAPRLAVRLEAVMTRQYHVNTHFGVSAMIAHQVNPIYLSISTYRETKVRTDDSPLQFLLEDYLRMDAPCLRLDSILNFYGLYLDTTDLSLANFRDIVDAEVSERILELQEELFYRFERLTKPEMAIKRQRVGKVRRITLGSMKVIAIEIVKLGFLQWVCQHPGPLVQSYSQHHIDTLLYHCTQLFFTRFNSILPKMPRILVEIGPSRWSISDGRITVDLLKVVRRCVLKWYQLQGCICYLYLASRDYSPHDSEWISLCRSFSTTTRILFHQLPPEEIQAIEGALQQSISSSVDLSLQYIGRYLPPWVLKSDQVLLSDLAIHDTGLPDNPDPDEEVELLELVNPNAEFHCD